MITQSYLLKLFDTYEDGSLYWKKYHRKCNRQSSSGYLNVDIDGKTYKVHRIIFMMHHGYMPEYIDHINGNKLDNRIENLRKATKEQNGWNRGIQKNNKSGIKGVSWNSQSKKWRVQLRHDGKVKYIGQFEDLELAELVATETRNKFHGDYARHR